MDLTLGAILGPDRACRFRVWAPRAERIDVRLLDPSERLVPMTREADGHHSARVQNVAPGTRYFLRIDGERDRPDPASRHQPEGVHGPSAVVAPLLDVAPAGWRGRTLDDYVLYELHVGTFTPEGTFDAAIGRLAHLVDLGVTAVELMPIAEFPGGRNWGYDGAHPFAAQSTYGGPDALRRLVDACHAQGLAVVLDVVYNHLGPEGTYLAEFGPYFSRHQRTDWGEAPNFDGHGSDALRRYFLENALYWLRSLRFDGLRLDAVNWIRDARPTHFLEELGAVVADEERRQGRPLTLIAESLYNDPRVIRPRARHGFGMHGQWCDDFHHALHAALTGERNGYYADFGGVEPLARALRQGYHFVGQHSLYRGRGHGRAPDGFAPHQFVVYAQNHDVVGNRAQGERLGSLVDFASLKLAALATLLSANVPLLFMGEETGDTRPFPFFTSHGDAALIEAVRVGRRHEFAEFGWTQPPPDPQDEATFRSAVLSNAPLSERARVLLEWHRTLIRLRREDVVLRHLAWPEVAADASTGVVTQLRTHGPDARWIALHLGSAPAEVALPPGRWRRLLDSADATWAGPGSAVAETSSGPILLAPRQAVALARE